QSAATSALCRRATARNRPTPWAPGRLCRRPAPPAAAACRRSRRAGWVGQSARTRLRPRSPTPIPGGLWRGELAGRATFFSSIVRVGTGNPVLGPLPVGLEALERLPNGFMTDRLLGQSVFPGDFGQQMLGPDALV